MTRGLHWLRGWVPPEAIRLLNHWTGRNSRLSGSYRSWEEASRNADGYDSAAILDRAREAMLAIRDGRGAFVRDGVVFPEPDPPLPLLSGLMRVAACAGGHLRVLDFGGALGSTYYQCRKFLQGLPSVRWQVVEQPQFVACGSEVFADGVLGFSSSISEAAHSDQSERRRSFGRTAVFAEPRRHSRRTCSSWSEGNHRRSHADNRGFARGNCGAARVASHRALELPSAIVHAGRAIGPFERPLPAVS